MQIANKKMGQIPYGTIIKNFRIKSGYTQTVLGNKIGVGKTTISAYEHNQIMPPTDIFVNICNVCNVELLFKTSEKISTMVEMSREY